MTIWIVGENTFVDILVEPHLAQTYTICANDPAELGEIAQIAPQPIFKTVHGCKFEWAVHLPMKRVLPDSWNFLDRKQSYLTERLEKPISPHPTQWYWEACRVYD